MSRSSLLECAGASRAGIESSPMAPVMVRIWNLHKSYGRTEVLKGIDLTVHRGEVVTVIGSSGSGKSTLLSCINFLEPFDRGAITIDGQPIGWVTGAGGRMRMGERELNLMRQRIGIVFQQFNLFPHLTVLQNVIEAPIQVKGLAANRPSQSRTSSLRASVCAPRRTPIRASFRAGSSSAPPSHAALRWIRR